MFSISFDEQGMHLPIEIVTYMLAMLASDCVVSASAAVCVSTTLRRASGALVAGLSPAARERQQLQQWASVPLSADAGDASPTTRKRALTKACRSTSAATFPRALATADHT
jgi:hypothetical protein